MRRKSPSGDEPTLFSFHQNDSPEPTIPVNSNIRGDHDAVQNDSSRTTEGAARIARTATADAQTSADARNLLQGTEGQSRDLEGDAGDGEPRQRSEPDRQRSVGTGDQGTGGSFADRLTGGRFALARPGNGRKSHVQNVRASRDRRSLFDIPSPEPPPTGTRPPPAPTATERHPPPASHEPPQRSGMASGEKTKARDIIAAIRTLQTIEHEGRPATPDEKHILGRFSGFGPVALSIFPDPVTGKYKDAGWQSLGEELKSLLTPAEYDSAKRTTFNAFYTPPTVVASIHKAIARLGVPGNATILEPLCGRPHN